jgi:hypothetical protein
MTVIRSRRASRDVKRFGFRVQGFKGSEVRFGFTGSVQGSEVRRFGFNELKVPPLRVIGSPRNP